MPEALARGAVAMGNLDGVHRGHQALVEATVSEARQRGSAAVVLTFDPHPARVLVPEHAPRALMTLGQKREVLATLGVDALLVLPFTPERATQSAEDFAASVLKDDLAAAVVVVGESFRFGHGRAGSLATLQDLGERLGFAVKGVAPVLEDGIPVSSSRVRAAVAAGDVKLAAVLLGRPYALDGTVVAGDGRGRTIGIPTANLAPVNELLPARGVYASRARTALSPSPLAAVVNVGQRPTFGGTTVTIEAHLLDFQGDLYGTSLRVEFLEHLREEARFSSPEALVAQIQADIAHTRAVVVMP
jgi:riboflavin kinase / FMN adenylyltransferase